MQIVTVLGESQDLWQWDLGRKVSVNDETCTSVHFGDVLNDKSYQVSVNEENGERVAYVPNIVLQNSGVLPVYAYLATADGGYTIRKTTLDVKRKEKPVDYVYTEEDLEALDNLSKRITALAAAFNSEPKAYPVKVFEEMTTDGTHLVVDKTFSEIAGAVSNNYWVYCVYSTSFIGEQAYFWLSDVNTSEISFVCVSPEKSNKIVITEDGVDYSSVGIVHTVNGVAPDENGNVNVSGGGDGASGAVLSVNGKVGVVQLTAEDVGALPNTTEIPSVPSALPNPNALTFTGAVEATYDGSESVEVEIPQGGGGSADWAIFADITTTEGVGIIKGTIPEAAKEVLLFFKCPAVETAIASVKYGCWLDDSTIHTERRQWNSISAGQSNMSQAHFIRFGNMFTCLSGISHQHGNLGDFRAGNGYDSVAGNTFIICSPYGTTNFPIGTTVKAYWR